MWLWYRCQNRIEKYYHHDGEQITYYKNVLPGILGSLGGCYTMFIFAVFCKIGALERNAYWFHV